MVLAALAVRLGVVAFVYNDWLDARRDHIYFSADWMWPTCLTTILLVSSFLLVLHLKTANNKWAWVGFGLLSGFAALNDPNVLSVLPLLAFWVCLARRRYRQRWFSLAALA